MTIVGVPNTQRVLFVPNSTLRFNTKNQANGRQVGPLQSVLAVMSLLSLPSLRCQLGLQRWRLHPLRVFFFPGAAICGASQPWRGAGTWTNLLGPALLPVGLQRWRLHPLRVFFPGAAICGRGHGAELGRDEAARPRSPPHPESELALTMDAPMARCGDENWFPVRSITLSTMLGSVFLL